MRVKKYWIVCVSKEHVKLAVEGGIIQVCHGKKQPLSRMQKDDYIVIYSSKKKMSDAKSSLQAFTAIGMVSDNEIYQYTMSEDFTPFRRKVEYFECDEIPIMPLINFLHFIQNKKFWGYPFRYGIIEIDIKDFELIYSRMRCKKTTPLA
ncbi:MAG: EVE domain-containing protein [Campylobacteraceae bacterium]|jgi:predicted RNA-binding protein|nr:EVE domain-containing protein [Campylobacteraceae bacterium]